MSAISRRLLPLLCLLVVPLAAHAGRAYVSNEDGESVTVIDTDKGTVIQTVPIGKRPRGLKLSHDGSQLFVALSGLAKCPPTVPDEECAKLERDLKADGIGVMDTKTLKVVRMLHAGSDPEQFAVHPDGRIFVANEDVATASVVDPKSGKVLARVKVGEEPEGVGISPDGKWVLVTNEEDNSVSVIDAKALKEVHHLIVGKRPRDVAFTPDSKFAYVSGEFDASLYRVGLPAGKPIERVLQMRKEAKPMALQLDSKRNRMYMSTGRGGTVAVIDLLPKPKLVSEIQVGARPWGIALSPDGTRLYTANGPSNDVSIVDTATLKVVKKIPVGRSPWGIVLGD
jgi:PQQ-dependent catabolism-associated beta-propeller protein